MYVILYVTFLSRWWNPLPMAQHRILDILRFAYLTQDPREPLPWFQSHLHLQTKLQEPHLLPQPKCQAEAITIKHFILVHLLLILLTLHCHWYRILHHHQWDCRFRLWKTFCSVVAGRRALLGQWYLMLGDLRSLMDCSKRVDALHLVKYATKSLR